MPKKKAKKTRKKPKRIPLDNGRPTVYRKEYDELVFNLCLLGATDKQIATTLGIAESTLNRWKEKHKGFRESLKQGKDYANGRVVRALYERALGYSHPEEKIFQHDGEIIRATTTKHYPPDTAAAIIWLKNRQALKWRDNHDVNLAGNISFGPVVLEMAGGNGDSTTQPNVTPDQVSKNEDVQTN